eukprot:6210821-Pleurochrysis_carterae.AAC.2
MEQRSDVFSGSIIENINLGLDDADEASAEEACKLAGLWEDVCSFADGLHTQVRMRFHPCAHTRSLGEAATQRKW